MTPTLLMDKQWCADFAQGWHIAGLFKRSGMLRQGQRSAYAMHFAAEMQTSRKYRSSQSR